jgi:hypothetical protein
MAMVSGSKPKKLKIGEPAIHANEGWGSSSKVRELAQKSATLGVFQPSLGSTPDSNGGRPMITFIQRRGKLSRPLKGEETKEYEKSYFEFAGLER